MLSAQIGQRRHRIAIDGVDIACARADITAGAMRERLTGRSQLLGTLEVRIEVEYEGTTMVHDEGA